MARILMVLDHPYPPDIRVENEAESLSRAGFDVTVLSIGPDSRPAEDTSGAVRIVRDRLPAGIRNRMRGLAGSIPVLTPYLSHRIREMYTSWPFEAIHAHDLYLVGGALEAGRRLGVKVVADLHENWVAALGQYAWSTRFPGRLFVNLDRWQQIEMNWLERADRIVVVIEEMAERLANKSIPREKIVVIPNTINRERFDAFGIDPLIADSMKSKPALLYTGGMDRHRGIECAIRAMAEVTRVESAARLVLVGDGAVRSDLEKLTMELDLGHCIEFRGWQPQPSIPSYIAGADIGLIPHIKSDHTDHTIPHKLFHYMYLGIPVVASNCRPIERIVRETGSGRIFPTGDHHRLADIIVDLFDSAELMGTLGANGRRAVEQTYHWERTSEQLVALYSGMLG